MVHTEIRDPLWGVSQLRPLALGGGAPHKGHLGTAVKFNTVTVCPLHYDVM